MPARPGQKQEKIRAHLFPTGGTLPVLTKKEQDIVARYRLVVKEISERPFQSDTVLRNWIMAQFGRTWHEADDDIANVRRIHSVTNMSKDMARYTVTELLKKAVDIAIKKGNEDAIIKAAEKIAKAYKLDKQEMHEIPWDQIIPPPFTVTDDVTTLGLKPISEERLARLKEKLFKDAEIVEPDEPNRD